MSSVATAPMPYESASDLVPAANPSLHDERSQAAFLLLLLEAERPSASSLRVALEHFDNIEVGRSPDNRRHVHELGWSRLRIEIPDRCLSATHLRLVREGEVWCVEDAGSKNGTTVNGIRVRRAHVRDGDTVEAGSALFRMVCRQQGTFPEPRILHASSLMDRPAALATLNPELARRFEELTRVAAWEMPLLISGECGTGKTLTARAVHDLSGRRGELVTLDASTIRGDLIGSERVGRRRVPHSVTRAAAGGTLVLDDVADLSPLAQRALGRMLERAGCVASAGADSDSGAGPARIIAITRADLEARVRAGTFCSDLYSRLTGAVVSLPALRHRSEDIGLLIGNLLQDLSVPRGLPVRLRRSAARGLCNYAFPGNIRELGDALRAALRLSSSNEVSIDNLNTALVSMRRSGRRH